MQPDASLSTVDQGLMRQYLGSNSESLCVFYMYIGAAVQIGGLGGSGSDAKVACGYAKHGSLGSCRGVVYPMVRGHMLATGTRL